MRLVIALQAYRDRDATELGNLDPEEAEGHLWDQLLTLGSADFHGADHEQIRSWLHFLTAGMKRESRQKFWLHELYLFAPDRPTEFHIFGVGMTAPKPGALCNPGTKARPVRVPQPGGIPARRPGGARCIGGVSSSQALAWNGRTCCLRTVVQSKWAMKAPRMREGDPQAANTARGRVPGGAGADRPVVAMKAL